MTDLIKLAEKIEHVCSRPMHIDTRVSCIERILHEELGILRLSQQVDMDALLRRAYLRGWKDGRENLDPKHFEAARSILNSALEGESND